MNEVNIMRLEKSIKKYRQLRNLSQQDLAELLYVSRQAVS